MEYLPFFLVTEDGPASLGPLLTNFRFISRSFSYLSFSSVFIGLEVACIFALSADFILLVSCLAWACWSSILLADSENDR